MRPLIKLSALTAALSATAALAENCFINRSDKEVRISMKDFVIEDTFTLPPRQRQCFTEPARFELSANFGGSPPEWYQRKTEERGENYVVDGRVVRTGSSVPFYVHRADIRTRDSYFARDIEILLSDQQAVRVTTRPLSFNARPPVSNAPSCSAKTINRAQSDHTWVKFELPTGTSGQTIKIPGGAYTKYVFPKCNRVHWNDHTYQCKNGSWTQTRGEAGADILCHGGPPSSEFVKVGTR